MPANPEPRHVLLDIDPDDFSLDGLQQERLLPFGVVFSRVSTVCVHRPLPGFSSDPVRQEYHVSSDALQEMNFRQAGSDGRELFRYVNESDLRVSAARR